MDIRMVLTEARLYSSRVAQQVADEANKKAPDERGAFFGTAATMITQTCLTSIALQMGYKPGSPEGEAFLKSIYENALKDALERWRKADLKERFE